MESDSGGLVSLFVLLASEARQAVVFRRGPSRQMLLLSWDRETDRVTPGLWLKGRVYERRCDLSPSGEWLVYFAAGSGGAFPCWTAVCRPPAFTALALWPKYDTLGGGGLFDSASCLRLNHGLEDASLAPGFRAPRDFRVAPLRDHPRKGDDFLLYELRLLRDGWWRLEDPDAPPSYRKANPAGEARGLELQMSFSGRELGGPAGAAEYSLFDPETSLETPLGRLDWADWDTTGELLFARGGRLFRLEPRPEAELGALREVADLRGLDFQDGASPPHAA